MTENQRAGLVALLIRHNGTFVFDIFLNKKDISCFILVLTKKVNNRKIRVKFSIFKMIDSTIYHAKCNRISLEIAQTLMARLPCLTRYRSWVPMNSYLRLLWSDFCIDVFLLLFSLSVFSDWWSKWKQQQETDRRSLIYD